MIGIYIHIMESQREASPLFFNYFPLSFEGEGDKGGEVEKQSRLLAVSANYDYNVSGIS